MTFWLVVPLFALAQASCYDYEYYDPGTGSSIPGNACAKQQAGGATAGASATIGQPVAAQAGTVLPASTNFLTPASTSYGALATSYPSAPIATAYGAAPAFPAAAAYGAAPVFGASPVVASPQVFASSPFYGTPAVAANTVYGAAPRAVAVSYGTPTVAVSSQVSYTPATTTQARAAASNPDVASQRQQLEYYKRLGEQQQREHKQNSRIVQQASQQLQRGSLVNTLIAGSGKTSSWYPAYRLDAQRDAAGAYKSEARIANKNANDAYQRYQQSPTRLNLLVSKYQDLNADLRDAAYHYNVINSGTFGQITRASSLFGLGTGGGLLNTMTQVITQRKESDDLQDIQRQMQRIARQIQAEARAAQAAIKGGSSVQAAQQQQGSVPQRMMAMSVYGPQQQRG